MQGILATTYPLTFSCYYGAQEVKTTFTGYVSTVMTPINLARNALVNLGNFYDSLYYLIKYTMKGTKLIKD
jgi:hypothetical protein